MEEFVTVELDLDNIHAFLQELKTLCNKYQLEIAGCGECEVAVLTAFPAEHWKPIEQYELDGDHLIPVYAKKVLAA